MLKVLLLRYHGFLHHLSEECGVGQDAVLGQYATQHRADTVKLTQPLCHQQVSTLLRQTPPGHDTYPVQVVQKYIHIVLAILGL